MPPASDGSASAGAAIAKRAAARAAVAEIADGMLVGLGTGTTVAFAIEALAERVGAGLRIETVATSRATGNEARRRGIAVRDFADVPAVDMTIDGVDEIDPGFLAIKGAGGAMLREKIVAAATRRMIAIADAGKAVARLGAAPVPVEVLPFARAFVAAQVAALGAAAALRRRPDGAEWRTDQDNLILDCRFDAIDDARALAAALAAIPGLLGHGLFIDEIDMLYIGDGGGAVRRRERRRAGPD